MDNNTANKSSARISARISTSVTSVAASTSSTVCPMVLSDMVFPASGERSQAERRLLAFLAVVSGALVLAALARISIFLPFTPVPITGQSFGVLLVATILGSKKGVVSVAVYISMGAMGAPFFAAGVGPLVLLGPTGGYLVGFLASAFVVGYLAEKSKDRKLFSALLVFILGKGIIYFFGVLWLSALVGFPGSLNLGLYPFLLGGGVKVILLSLMMPALWKFVGRY